MARETMEFDLLAHDRASKVFQDVGKAATNQGKAIADAAKLASRAQSSQADAAGKLRVAEAKLADLRRSGKAQSSAIVAAEEAVAKARRGTTTASEEAKRATDAYARAGKDAGTSIDRGLKKVNGRRIGGSIGQSLGKGMRVGIGGPLAQIGGLMAGVFAAKVGVDMFKGFIDDARESRKVAAITESTIKATGGAAKVTADQVGDLATAISNKTGADDEAVQSGTNLLLTFKNVRNEAGKQNDILNQATQSAVDLSAAGFGSISSASVLMGKALNDPIKGLTALGKSGVTFTQQQKDQIKTLVETGHTLEAQKIILKEVQGQVGGAAEAASDPMQKLGVILGNVGEQIGGYLLPYVDKAATWLGTNLPVAMAAAEVWARKAFGYFQKNVLPTLLDVADFVMDNVVPSLKLLGKWIVQNWKVFLPLTAAVIALNVAMSANPIALVVIAIGALVVAAVAAYRKFETFRNVIDVAWDVIQNAAKFAWERVLKPVFGFLVAAVKAYWQAFQTALPYIQRAWTAITAAATFAWTRILKPTFDALSTVIKGAWERFQAFARVVSAAWEGVRRIVGDGVKAVVKFFLIMAGGIIDAAANAFGWIPGIGGKLRDAQAAFHKFRDGVNDQLDRIDDKTINIRTKIADQTVALSKATGITKNAAAKIIRQQGFADGGPVYGAGTGRSDSIPAMLSHGENVWDAATVKRAGGQDAVEEMKHAIRGFRDGGPVDFNVRNSLPRHKETASIAGAASAAAEAATVATTHVVSRSLSRMMGAAAKKAAAEALATTGAVSGGTLVGTSVYGGRLAGGRWIRDTSDDPGIGNHGNKLVPGSYAELNMGTALGGLPVGHKDPLSYKGRSIMGSRDDIGAGGGNVQGHKRALDLWYETANALHFFGGLGLVNFGAKQAGGPGGGALYKGKDGKFHIDLGGGFLTAGAKRMGAAVAGSVGDDGMWLTYPSNSHNPGDHGAGKAIDFMVPGDGRTAKGISYGNAVSSFLFRNHSALNMAYIVWRDHIASGRNGWQSWRPYSHPSGSTSWTDRHMNHVHGGVMDQGGYLLPGLNLLANKTGGKERILDRRETVAYERNAGSSSGGMIVEFHYHGTATSADQVAFGKFVNESLGKYRRGGGTLAFQK